MNSEEYRLEVSKNELSKALRPKKFSAYIGGYFGVSYNIHLARQGQMIYERCSRSEMTQEAPQTYEPSDSDWRGFRATLDAIAAWDWKLSYFEPACDGTNWSVDIVYDDRTLRSSGSNAYPPTEEFDAFCKAVSRLVGDSEFR